MRDCDFRGSDVWGGGQNVLYLRRAARGLIGRWGARRRDGRDAPRRRVNLFAVHATLALHVTFHYRLQR